MKRILCFGDSNTWGYDPETDERYDNKTRWPCAMANALGNEYEIVTYIGNCLKMNYKIDVTIHSTNIENYDPGTVKQFDKNLVIEKLNTIFATFHFR